jgi:hypothetical protein
MELVCWPTSIEERTSSIIVPDLIRKHPESQICLVNYPTTEKSNLEESILRRSGLVIIHMKILGLEILDVSLGVMQPPFFYKSMFVFPLLVGVVKVPLRDKEPLRSDIRRSSQLPRPE